jgi:hypothetical protein
LDGWPPPEHGSGARARSPDLERAGDGCCR